MGRIEFLLQPTGLIVVALLFLAAVLAFVKRRHLRNGASGDLLGPDGDEASGDRAGAGLPTVHPDFRSVLDKVILPRHRQHPDWERLDGAYDIRGRTIATFMRGGTAYALNGESRFDALMAVNEWMTDHPGQDPFVVPGGKGPAGRLVARPEVGIADPRALRIETD